jgi:hypothetical protein
MSIILFLPSYKGLGVDGFGDDGQESIPVQLQHIELSYVNSLDCQESMPLPITEYMMCAQGADGDQYNGVCFGGSGGKNHSPIYIYIYLVKFAGIISLMR